MPEAPLPIPTSVEDKPRVFPVPGWRDVLYCALLAWLPWMWLLLLMVVLYSFEPGGYWQEDLPIGVVIFVLLYALAVFLTAGMVKPMLRLHRYSPVLSQALLLGGVVLMVNLFLWRYSLAIREGVVWSVLPMSPLLMGLLHRNAAGTQSGIWGEAGRVLAVLAPYVSLHVGMTLHAVPYCHDKWMLAGVALAEALSCSLVVTALLVLLARMMGHHRHLCRVLYALAAACLPACACWVLGMTPLRCIPAFAPVFIPVPILLAFFHRQYCTR